MLQIIHNVLDILLPRRCIICGRRLVRGEEIICVTCDLNLPRLAEEDPHLIERYLGRADVEKITAHLYYTPKSNMAEMVYAKYRNRQDVGRHLGRRMAEGILPKDFFEGIDCIVPMPLTRGRKQGRGFNQCEEMAKGVADVTGLPVLDNCLKRTEFRESQTKLSIIQRPENVRGCFSLNEKAKDSLQGKHVLLIDDVVTSGATTIECTNVLHTVPDVKVSVLAFAIKKRL